MRVVAALGGNALLKRGEKQSVANQWANVRVAAAQLAEIVMAGHQLVITHGNGPQVGMLALQSEAGPSDAQAPLDVLDAESEGMIGYMIEQQMRNRLPAGAKVATLLTHVRVDASDPAFKKPQKPIGAVYSKAEAARIKAERGWQMTADGDGWRRVVASPEPLEILQQPEIAVLMAAGVTVICAGGGGIPCVRDANGFLTGAEAVVDKDRCSGLLATLLGADRLLMLTDVDATYLGFGTPNARAIRRSDPTSLRGHRSDFRAGTMGPKIDGAIQFVTSTGGLAGIGRLEDAANILRGVAGTIVDPLAKRLQFAG
ncbi:carbamate kinase [Acidisoma sp. L85]|uniref:carbamate kinase n=1 Tax=Acidisoma sp. L85 TaxID=1641850 RepID=UPI00131ACF63|nr:carbamate kinase [Acidisoma sp. L85]